MDIYNKILKNVEKIDKVTGFYITAPGDPSVGINPATWEIKNDFYFDTPEELEEFRKELKNTFEWYCGEVISVITFEEHQTMLDAEDQMMYEQYPVRYLIKDDDYNGMYMKTAPFHGMYSSDVSECIHLELPKWVDEKDVIPSTSPEYWNIIKKALESEHRTREVNGQHYHAAVRSIRILQKELDLGKK